MKDGQINPGFALGHATHYDWRMACELALAQIEPWFQQHQHRAGLVQHQNAPLRWLAWLYFTPSFANEAEALLRHVIERTGITNWIGCCSECVLAGSAEYRHEPALALMVGAMPSDSFEVFSGRRPKVAPGVNPSPASTIFVHADPQLSDLGELLDALSQRHEQAPCHGGICSGLDAELPQLANEVFHGGLSGVVFRQSAGVRQAFSQGCRPIGTRHHITKSDRHLVRHIDDRPAMDVLLQELGVAQESDHAGTRQKVLQSLPKEKLQGGLLVEIADPERLDQPGLVRNLLGIDPSNGSIAIAGQAEVGWSLRFCTRDPQTARDDLVASCTALRESIEEAGQKILALIYVSCLARGEHLFGRAGLEGQWVQHYLQAPLMIGFQANGEIHQNQLHGYSAVLLAICTEADQR
ncbi:MAG: hypothetical protein EBZ03_10895 [Betaproteobacteria bacterium]|nr:hypothetical protein [Betaproteobacteria bacterium]NCZ99691.1 hypothetical protein [Betaproteobacteria bacterium]NDB97248.1 hypothetical protein [Betaproteobacteria bacterium]